MKSLHLHPFFAGKYWNSTFEVRSSHLGSSVVVISFFAFSKVHPYQKLKKEAPLSQWQTEMNYSF